MNKVGTCRLLEEFGVEGRKGAAQGAGMVRNGMRVGGWIWKQH